MRVAALVLGILGAAYSFVVIPAAVFGSFGALLSNDLLFLIGLLGSLISFAPPIVGFVGAILAYINPRAGGILLFISICPSVLLLMAVMMLGVSSQLGIYDRTLHDRSAWFLTMLMIGVSILLFGLATVFAFKAEESKNGPPVEDVP